MRGSDNCDNENSSRPRAVNFLPQQKISSAQNRELYPDKPTQHTLNTTKLHNTNSKYITQQVCVYIYMYNISYMLQITYKFKHCTDSYTHSCITSINRYTKSINQQTSNVLYNKIHFLRHMTKKHPRSGTECSATEHKWI
jgi:hypothetical protein